MPTTESADATTDTGAVRAGETNPPVASPKRSRRAWFAITLAVVVVALDQLTKWWAVTTLSEVQARPFIGDLIRFQLVYNSGAAFSFATGHTWVFTIVAAVAVVVVIWFGTRATSWGWLTAFGLVLGGAATHLGDRLFREPSFGQGHVVDFIAYANFFIGNVADIAIFTGAVMILLLSLFGVRMRRVTREPLVT